MKKNSTEKSLKIKSFLAAQAAQTSKYFCFGGIAPKLEFGIL
jgi:hypothetical protein